LDQRLLGTPETSRNHAPIDAKACEPHVIVSESNSVEDFKTYMLYISLKHPVAGVLPLILEGILCMHADVAYHDTQIGHLMKQRIL
jgi:hypothetical protein